MANYLEANPDEAERAKGAAWGGLVPIVRGGRIVVLANRRNVAKIAPGGPLTVEDYVVGLEVLGHVFVKTDGGGWQDMWSPLMPEAWWDYSRALQSSLDEGSRTELFAFLNVREAVEG